MSDDRLRKARRHNLRRDQMSPNSPLLELFASPRGINNYYSSGKVEEKFVLIKLLYYDASSYVRFFQKMKYLVRISVSESKLLPASSVAFGQRRLCKIFRGSYRKKCKLSQLRDPMICCSIVFILLM